MFTTHTLSDFCLTTTPSNYTYLSKGKPPPSTFRDQTSIRKKSIEREVNHTLTTDFLRENIRERGGVLETCKQPLKKKSNKETIESKKRNFRNLINEKFSPLENIKLRRLSNNVESNKENISIMANNPSALNCNFSFLNPDSAHREETKTAAVCKKVIKKLGHTRTFSAVVTGCDSDCRKPNANILGFGITQLEPNRKFSDNASSQLDRLGNKGIIKLDLGAKAKANKASKLDRSFNSPVFNNYNGTTSNAPIFLNMRPPPFNVSNTIIIGNNNASGPFCGNTSNGEKTTKPVKMNSRRVSLGDTHQSNVETKYQKISINLKRRKGNCTPNFDKDNSADKEELNFSHREARLCQDREAAKNAKEPVNTSDITCGHSNSTKSLSGKSNNLRNFRNFYANNGSSFFDSKSQASSSSIKPNNCTDLLKKITPSNIHQKTESKVANVNSFIREKKVFSSSANHSRRSSLNGRSTAQTALANQNAETTSTIEFLEQLKKTRILKTSDKSQTMGREYERSNNRRYGDEKGDEDDDDDEINFSLNQECPGDKLLVPDSQFHFDQSKKAKTEGLKCPEEISLKADHSLLDELFKEDNPLVNKEDVDDSFFSSPEKIWLSQQDLSFFQGSAEQRATSFNGHVDKDTYLLLIEKEKTYAVDPQFLQRRHGTLSWLMRAILIDWMSEVCAEYFLKRETFHLSISYLDRYLNGSCKVNKSELQLIGLASMFVASKNEEIYPPKIGDFVKSADNGYTEKQILDMEIGLFRVLNWHLNPPSVNLWVNWVLLKWDLYIESSPFVQYQLNSLSNCSSDVTFKKPNEQSYTNYREFFQIIDCIVLDVQFHQYKLLPLLNSILYLIIGLKYYQFDKERIYKEFPNSSHFLIAERSQFNNLFSSFTQESFAFELIELLPTIQFVATFFSLQLMTSDMPPVAKKNPNIVLEGHFEEFLSYHTHCRINLDFVKQRNR